MFNHETHVKNIHFPDWFYFDLIKWVVWNEMSNDEKNKHPNAEVINGYLKTFEYKEAWGIAFSNASQSEIYKVWDLPNFDPQIFFEITGIDYYLKNKKP